VVTKAAATFCVDGKIFSKTVARDTNRVVDEIEYLYHEFGVRLRACLSYRGYSLYENRPNHRPSNCGSRALKSRYR
jgi:hypothetical protein